MTFLTVACIILPPVSYDYTLLHLYTAWVPLVLLLIEEWREQGRSTRGTAALVLCFALLLAPLNEFILRGESLGGQIKCLALLGLALTILRFPFPASSAEVTRAAA